MKERSLIPALIAALRVTAGLASLPVLWYAGTILANLTGYRDSSPLTYLAFGVLPGTAGVVLLYVALLGFRLPRSTTRRRSSRLHG